MKKFTSLQITDILDCIDLRIDTISDDPESADEFETIENLNILMEKIKAKDINLTIAERAWICEELEWKIEMAESAKDNPEIGFKAQAEINSLRNAINKIQ